MALPTRANPLRLTLAEIKANALRALEEGRLQCLQGSGSPRYGNPSCCCIIGASLAPEVAEAADDYVFRAYALDKICAEGFFTVDDQEGASKLQFLHDQLCALDFTEEEKISRLLAALT
jgi:hypothetical protein